MGYRFLRLVLLTRSKVFQLVGVTLHFLNLLAGTPAKRWACIEGGPRLLRGS
jgi:hypothetical protein